MSQALNHKEDVYVLWSVLVVVDEMEYLKSVPQKEKEEQGLHS